MDKTDSKPVSDKELEEESEIEEVIEKDGAGYGDLQSLNAQPDDTNRDAETYVGRPAPKESETYIQERKSYSMGMTDQNKLKNTKLGDHINYYDNGVSGNGIVSKMSGQFIQIFKDDGKFYNININDTFHVSDILINKTWDAMDLAERTEQLMNIKAYSPRFLSKTWDQLPRELKDVMKVKTGAKPKGDYNSDLDEDSSSQAQATAARTNHRENRSVPNGMSARNNSPMDRSSTGANARFRKSNISKAEWDLMKDTEQDERGAKREQSHYFSDDDESEPFSMGNEEPPKPKGKKKKVKITKAEWDSMKSSSEDGAFGNTGSSPTTGVSTKIPFDATEDYEGTTHDILPEQFKYEDEKPEVGNEPKPEEVKLDGQGLIKTGEFVYSDRPNTYKIPAKEIGKGYGIKYGVKYINEEEDN